MFPGQPRHAATDGGAPPRFPPSRRLTLPMVISHQTWSEAFCSCRLLRCRQTACARLVSAGAAKAATGIAIEAGAAGSRVGAFERHFRCGSAEAGGAPGWCNCV